MLATTTALLMLINSVRTSPLKTDIKLQNYAKEHCESMQDFSHTDFLQKYSKLINDSPLYYKYAGENLAVGYSTTKQIFDALEASPTHHANNHSENFTKVGIASCQKAPGVWLEVILFAGFKYR